MWCAVLALSVSNLAGCYVLVRSNSIHRYRAGLMREWKRAMAVDNFEMARCYREMSNRVSYLEWLVKFWRPIGRG